MGRCTSGTRRPPLMHRRSPLRRNSTVRLSPRLRNSSRSRPALERRCLVAFRPFGGRWLVAAVLGAATLLVAHLYAVSDEQLFESGKAALDRGNSIDALMYLYAYQQRSPAVLQQSAEHSMQVDEAIRFSRGRLQSALDERTALEQEVHELRQRLGMSGVSGAPKIRVPTLDPPRLPSSPAYPIACRGSGGMQFSLVSGGYGLSGTMVVIGFHRSAGFGTNALNPGECAWMDRPINEQEPDHICDPVTQVHVQWSADGAVQNLSSRSAPYLAALTVPAQVYTFQVADNGNGCLVVRDGGSRRGRGRE